MSKNIVYYLMIEGTETPFYVGKTIRTPHIRLREHLSEVKQGYTSIKANVIRKAQNSGKRIVLKTVATADTENEAFVIEQALIKEFGRRDLGTGILTNMSDGGEGPSGYQHTASARKVMSEIKLGNKLNIGRPRPDMVERFSKSITAFNKDGGVIGHFSSARKASATLGVDYRAISLCCKKKIVQTKGYMFRYGYYDTPIPSISEQKPKRARPDNVRKYKSVVGTHLDGSVREFASIKEASLETGVLRTDIGSICNGRIVHRRNGWWFNFKEKDK